MPEQPVKRSWINADLATMDPAQQRPYGALERHALRVEDGRIVAMSSRWPNGRRRRARRSSTLPAAGSRPAWIDCHTHLVWGGNRADEFERRLAGASYADIAAAGGGIRATVRATRAASEEELAQAAAARLAPLLAEGLTTVEIKSGYGLDRGRRAEAAPRRPAGRRAGAGGRHHHAAGSPCRAAGI